jgi:hypothetical protein
MQFGEQSSKSGAAQQRSQLEVRFDVRKLGFRGRVDLLASKIEGSAGQPTRLQPHGRRPIGSESRSRFYESVSAGIYGQNLIWSNLHKFF